MPAATTKVEFAGSQGNLAAALELPATKPRAFALFAHCFSCTKDIRAAREIARGLRAAGFAVLRFDFTGLGSSEGDFANTNFSSNVEDLIKAADFLRREHEAPAMLVGHSLGGAASLIAASRIPEARAVVTIAAPADASHVLKYISDARAEIEAKGVATVNLEGRPFTMRKQFLDDLAGQRVLDAAAELKKPLLILHAPRDDQVGVENATKLFIAAKHPKSFVSLDTADHLLSKMEDARYAAEVLGAWAGRYVDQAPAVTPPEARRKDAIDGGEAVMIPERRYAVAARAGGFSLIVDADAEEGGDGLGPNPTRVVEAALAACSAITMRMYAERKSWKLDRLRVTVTRAEGENAHLSRTLNKEVEVAGLDETQSARLHEIGDRCPVHRMLAEGVKIVSMLA